MRLSSIVTLGLVGMVSIVGCAGAAEEEASPGDEQNVSALFSPEALARLLGTNNALNHLGQFIDPRAEVGTPVGQEFGECCTGAMIGHGNVNLNEFKDLIERGRLAVTERLPIVVGDPPTITHEHFADTQCINKFGVYVRASKGEFLRGWTTGGGELVPVNDVESGAVLDANAVAAFQTAMKGAIDKTIVEVVIVPEDGDPSPFPLSHRAPRTLHLAFAVVRRPLSNAPGAPVNGFWTIVGAEIDTGRCTFPSAGEGEGEGEGD